MTWRPIWQVAFSKQALRAGSVEASVVIQPLLAVTRGWLDQKSGASRWALLMVARWGLRAGQSAQRCRAEAFSRPSAWQRWHTVSWRLPGVEMAPLRQIASRRRSASGNFFTQEVNALWLAASRSMR